MRWPRLIGKKEMERTSKEREHLTPDECRLIFQTGRCPDCGGGLCEGPRGGMSVNYACMECYSEFNLIWVLGMVVGERISDKGPRQLGDRASVYGLHERS
jgi:hypothetical protein